MYRVIVLLYTNLLVCYLRIKQQLEKYCLFKIYVNIIYYITIYFPPDIVLKHLRELKNDTSPGPDVYTHFSSKIVQKVLPPICLTL